jgi:hypothetical protein
LNVKFSDGGTKQAKVFSLAILFNLLVITVTAYSAGTLSAGLRICRKNWKGFQEKTVRLILAPQPLTNKNVS